MAFLTADIEPGRVARALWDLFFPVLEYEMNAIGPWQSVNEGVFFRSALEKPAISLTLFTARGLDVEDFGSFLADRQRPPNEYFLQLPEFNRRASARELLLLSISPPGHARQSRDVILRRNWAVCQLADVVFIGGAQRVAKEWSSKDERWISRRQKTFALARQLVKAGVPVFTVDHPDNRDLLDLGIHGVTPATVDTFLGGLSAAKSRPRETGHPSPKRRDLATAFEAPARPRQLELFPPNKARKRSRGHANR